MNVDLKTAKELGLSEEEYQKILDCLGRTPTYTELGIFSVMWSEHCSYKNSILRLKTLPREGKNLLVSAGDENAGLVDIGEGLAIAFKIESHNHPSAVEPYQGAATGVGGILRDIFTMGARPIAALNSLRFGVLNSDLPEHKSERVKYLFKNVVKGVGDYGNCFGVPTIGGEVYFEECYTDNPLVNAMAAGIVKHNQTATAKASGIGNPVFIVGSSTGKDGIHGATFASEEISEKSESKRPNVQVGDPFTEKLLLEATLEVIQAGLVVGIQDMGAAGITCSTSEMSAKGECGMEIDLDKVPIRETDMTSYEIMLSESQERMLVVIQKGKENEVKEIFSKWDLNCVQIGTVIKEPVVRIFHKGIKEAEIPADILVLGGGAPAYKRETKKPEYMKETCTYGLTNSQIEISDTILKLLASPNITNKNWVYGQYDQQVRTNTMILPGGDASVIRIKNDCHSNKSMNPDLPEKAVAFSVDCNGRYVYLDPYKGAMIAVCESARNVVCTGAKPLAITNCLNFGNPYNPEVYWQFTEAVRGIGDACRKLETPVTGGNVSFYNQSQDNAIYPTPVIGMLGLIENSEYAMTSFFKNENDVIVLLGNDSENKLDGSEYLNTIHNLVKGGAPHVDLDEEKRLYEAVLEMINSRLINSAHDISDGGLAIALAECCIMYRPHQIGCVIDLNIFKSENEYTQGDVSITEYLFNESQGRIIVSFNENNLEKVKEISEMNNVPFKILGKTGGNSFKINETESSLEDLEEAYYNSIKAIMEK
ncbi:phosphoribosylformylglycinamidine synthase subunit PurL [soil metagenome]